VQHHVDRSEGRDGFGQIARQAPEAAMGLQVRDVGRRAGEEVVQAGDLMPIGDQSLAQMAAEKPGSAGHHHMLGIHISTYSPGPTGNAEPGP
jgi:hypothetical protein